MAVDRIGDDRAAPLGAATMWRTAGHRLFASRCKARLRAAEKAGALPLQRNERGLGRSSIRHAPSRTWWPRRFWKPQDCGNGGSTLAQAVVTATGLLTYLDASAIACCRRPRMRERRDDVCTAFRLRWLEMLITAATATTRMTGPLRLHCEPVGNHLGRLVVDGGRSGTCHFGPTGPTALSAVTVLSARTGPSHGPSSVTAGRSRGQCSGRIKA